MLNTEKGADLITTLQKRMAQDTENPTAENMWSGFENFCRKAAETVLGISKGGLDSNKDSTWWNEDVKTSLKTKKDLFKQWQS